MGELPEPPQRMAGRDTLLNQDVGEQGAAAFPLTSHPSKGNCPILAEMMSLSAHFLGFTSPPHEGSGYGPFSLGFLTSWPRPHSLGKPILKLSLTASEVSAQLDTEALLSAPPWTIISGLCESGDMGP